MILVDFDLNCESIDACIRFFGLSLGGLLTAQRRANVVAMRWPELNLERAEWQLSGEFTKNGEPHLVPPTAEAVAILKNRQEKGALTAAAHRRGKGEKAEPMWTQFVFPSERSESGHITDFASAWGGCWTGRSSTT